MIKIGNKIPIVILGKQLKVDYLKFFDKMIFENTN